MEIEWQTDRDRVKTEIQRIKQLEHGKMGPEQEETRTSERKNVALPTKHAESEKQPPHNEI